MAVCSALGQGTFRNLDFELANVPALPQGQYGSLNGVLAADAIPYWSVFYGSYQTPMITYNNYTLGNANVSILGPHWDGNLGTMILEGNYTAVLQAGQWNATVSTSIAQTGTIPADTRSLQLRINPFGGYALGISFAGRELPVSILVERSPYDLTVGCDLSDYAGQSGELRLTALSYPNFRFASFGVDSIVFSSQAIAEPHTVYIILTGCLAYLYFHHRRPTGTKAVPFI